jgi:hypothetical protein
VRFAEALQAPGDRRGFFRDFFSFFRGGGRPDNDRYSPTVTTSPPAPAVATTVIDLTRVGGLVGRGGADGGEEVVVRRGMLQRELYGVVESATRHPRDAFVLKTSIGDVLLDTPSPAPDVPILFAVPLKAFLESPPPQRCSHPPPQV